MEVFHADVNHNWKSVDANEQVRLNVAPSDSSSVDAESYVSLLDINRTSKDVCFNNNNNNSISSSEIQIPGNPVVVDLFSTIGERNISFEDDVCSLETIRTPLSELSSEGDTYHSGSDTSRLLIDSDADSNNTIVKHVSSEKQSCTGLPSKLPDRETKYNDEKLASTIDGTNCDVPVESGTLLQTVAFDVGLLSQAMPKNGNMEDNYICLSDSDDPLDNACVDISSTDSLGDETFPLDDVLRKMLHYNSGGKPLKCRKSGNGVYKKDHITKVNSKIRGNPNEFISKRSKGIFSTVAMPPTKLVDLSLGQGDTLLSEDEDIDIVFENVVPKKQDLSSASAAYHQSIERAVATLMASIKKKEIDPNSKLCEMVGSETPSNMTVDLSRHFDQTTVSVINTNDHNYVRRIEKDVDDSAVRSLKSRNRTEFRSSVIIHNENPKRGDTSRNGNKLLEESGDVSPCLVLETSRSLFELQESCSVIEIIDLDSSDYEEGRRTSEADKVKAGDVEELHRSDKAGQSNEQESDLTANVLCPSESSQRKCIHVLPLENTSDNNEDKTDYAHDDFVEDSVSDQRKSIGNTLGNVGGNLVSVEAVDKTIGLAISDGSPASSVDSSDFLKRLLTDCFSENSDSCHNNDDKIGLLENNHEDVFSYQIPVKEKTEEKGDNQILGRVIDSVREHDLVSSDMNSDLEDELLESSDFDGDLSKDDLEDLLLDSDNIVDEDFESSKGLANSTLKDVGCIDAVYSDEEVPDRERKNLTGDRIYPLMNSTLKDDVCLDTVMSVECNSPNKEDDKIETAMDKIDLEELLLDDANIIDQTVEESNLGMDNADLEELLHDDANIIDPTVEKSNRDVPSDGSVESNRDVPSDRSIESNQDVPSDRSIESNRDVASDGSVEINQDFPSDGSVEINQDVPSDGSVESNQDVPSDGSVESNRDVPSDGSVEINQDVPSEGSVAINQDVPLDGNVEFNQDVPSDDSVESNHDCDHEASLLFHEDVDAFPLSKSLCRFRSNEKQDKSNGSVEINQDVPSDGSVKINQDVSSDGSVESNHDCDHEASLLFHEDVDAFPLSKSLCRFRSNEKRDKSNETTEGSGNAEGEQYLSNEVEDVNYDLVAEGKNDLQSEEKEAVENQLNEKGDNSVKDGKRVVQDDDVNMVPLEPGDSSKLAEKPSSEFLDGKMPDDDDDYIDIILDVSDDSYFADSQENSDTKVSNDPEVDDANCNVKPDSEATCRQVSRSSSGEFFDALDRKLPSSDDDFYDCHSVEPHELTIEEENDLLRSDEELETLTDKRFVADRQNTLISVKDVGEIKSSELNVDKDGIFIFTGKKRPLEGCDDDVGFGFNMSRKKSRDFTFDRLANSLSEAQSVPDPLTESQGVNVPSTNSKTDVECRIESGHTICNCDKDPKSLQFGNVCGQCDLITSGRNLELPETHGEFGNTALVSDECSSNSDGRTDKPEVLFDGNVTKPISVDMSISSIDMDRVLKEKETIDISIARVESIPPSVNIDMSVLSGNNIEAVQASVDPNKKVFPESHPDYKAITLTTNGNSDIPKDINSIADTLTVEQSLVPYKSSASKPPSPTGVVVQQSSRYVDYVSPDPLENEDNNSAGWQGFRELKTKEEKFLKVRSRWLNIALPDPNRDLTLRHQRSRVAVRSNVLDLNNPLLKCTSENPAEKLVKDLNANVENPYLLSHSDHASKANIGLENTNQNLIESINNNVSHEAVNNNPKRVQTDVNDNKIVPVNSVPSSSQVPTPCAVASGVLYQDSVVIVSPIPDPVCPTSNVAGLNVTSNEPSRVGTNPTHPNQISHGRNLLIGMSANVDFQSDDFPDESSSSTGFYTSPIPLNQLAQPEPGTWSAVRVAGNGRGPDEVLPHPNMALVPAARGGGGAAPRRGVKRALEEDAMTESQEFKRRRTIPCTMIYDNVLDCAKAELQREILALSCARDRAMAEVQRQQCLEVEGVVATSPNLRIRRIALETLHERHMRDTHVLATECEKRHARLVNNYNSKFRRVEKAVEELKEFRSFYHNASVTADNESFFMTQLEFEETKELYDYYSDMKNFYK